MSGQDNIRAIVQTCRLGLLGYVARFECRVLKCSIIAISCDSRNGHHPCVTWRLIPSRPCSTWFHQVWDDTGLYWMHVAVLQTGPRGGQSLQLQGYAFLSDWLMIICLLCFFVSYNVVYCNFIIVFYGICNYQVSASDRLSSYFCFPEADEIRPMSSYPGWVLAYHFWMWL